MPRAARKAPGGQVYHGPSGSDLVSGFFRTARDRRGQTSGPSGSDLVSGFFRTAPPDGDGRADPPAGFAPGPGRPEARRSGGTDREGSPWSRGGLGEEGLERRSPLDPSANTYESYFRMPSLSGIPGRAGARGPRFSNPPRRPPARSPARRSLARHRAPAPTRRRLASDRRRALRPPSARGSSGGDGGYPQGR
jgi:hypothetical protein